MHNLSFNSYLTEINNQLTDNDKKEDINTSNVNFILNSMRLNAPLVISLEYIQPELISENYNSAIYTLDSDTPILLN